MNDGFIVQSRTSLWTSLSSKDKRSIGLIAFYTGVALTLELYWIIFNQVMESRADLFATILWLYFPADHSWRIEGYSVAKALSLSLEGVNVFLTPVLSANLVWAILARRPYRYALQLLISTYTVYGTCLYYSVGHISGYANFEYKAVYTYAMFYLANLPWLVGYGWLAYEAYRALARAPAKESGHEAVEPG
jgi:hypothetical protein